jgi:hypothetical protein
MTQVLVQIEEHRKKAMSEIMTPTREEIIARGTPMSEIVKNRIADEVPKKKRKPTYEEFDSIASRIAHSYHERYDSDDHADNVEELILWFGQFAEIPKSVIDSMIDKVKGQTRIADGDQELLFKLENRIVMEHIRSSRK